MQSSVRSHQAIPVVGRSVRVLCSGKGGGKPWAGWSQHLRSQTSWLGTHRSTLPDARMQDSLVSEVSTDQESTGEKEIERIRRKWGRNTFLGCSTRSQTSLYNAVRVNSSKGLSSGCEDGVARVLIFHILEDVDWMPLKSSKMQFLFLVNLKMFIFTN